MPDPYEALASLIVSRPKLVAVVFCLLLATAFAGMSFISMATGIDTYVDKDTRRGMLLDRYLGTFQSDSLMILVETDNVLDPDDLGYIDRLERDVLRERYVRGASGITDLVKGRNRRVLPGSKS